MTTNLVKTIVYLDQETRQLVDAFAERNGLTVSHAIRACVVARLHHQVTIERGKWAELALRMLLRYHPSGDLERMAEEVLANEKRERLHG